MYNICAYKLSYERGQYYNYVIKYYNCFKFISFDLRRGAS